MNDRTLRIELTEEQARLYVESASFRHGVDAFFHGVVPLYLDGLAAKAARNDAEVQARIAEVQSDWMGAEGVDGELRGEEGDVA